jgi:hypothetical protein
MPTCARPPFLTAIAVDSRRERTLAGKTPPIPPDAVNFAVSASESRLISKTRAKCWHELSSETLADAGHQFDEGYPQGSCRPPWTPPNTTSAGRRVDEGYPLSPLNTPRPPLGLVQAPPPLTPAVNNATLKSMGLTIPEPFLLLADEVIE